MTSEERAQKIKTIMREQKVTAIDLQEKCGIHRNTIARALHGKGITVKTLEGIAEGLGISATLLI